MSEDTSKTAVEVVDNTAHTERAKAYTAATTALRKAHADEFRTLLHAEYAARGIAVKPRLTDEERNARDAQKIADKAAKAEAKRQAKIDALQAQIEALTA